MATRKSLTGSDTRSDILASASRLFIERGVDNTSLKDIARGCGISTGTLFYYYASKSDLIFDVTDEHFNQLTGQLMDWVSRSYQQTDLQQILQVVFDTIVGDITRGKLHHYLIQAAVSDTSSIRERFQQKYAEWRLMIQDGLSHFVEDDQQKKVFSQIILASLDGLVMQAILGIEDIPLQQITACLANSMKTQPYTIGGA